MLHSGEHRGLSHLLEGWAELYESWVLLLAFLNHSLNLNFPFSQANVLDQIKSF